MSPPQVAAALALCFGVLLSAAGGAASAPTFVTNERGLDPRNLDTSVSPCVDFYQYANGGWLARNPIPADQGTWGAGSEMRERNYRLLREVLDDAGRGGLPSGRNQGSNQQRVGDFWRTAMDTGKLEADGSAPLRADLDLIATLASAADVAGYVREQVRRGGATVLSLGAYQDAKDSTRYILYATQSGLGLPDRDYYTRTDEPSRQLREQYVSHIATMLRLVGEEPAASLSAARDVLGLETLLASASLTRVQLRDPAGFYNLKSPAEADALTPAFSWSALFRHLGKPDVATFSYAHPELFAAMNAALAEVPIATWRSYLRWQLIHEAAPYLAAAFADAHFDFFDRTLKGAREQRPRWQRAVDQTSISLGEALGEVYVARAFPPATKARANEVVETLRAVIGVRLGGLDWMSADTRQQALAKLSTLVSKIGYPDRWRDYTGLQIGREGYLANVRAATAFEMQRNLAKLGQPIDRNEWAMAPQTISAYYEPQLNEIVFPAAIIQPPTFDGGADDGVNFGGMGTIVGHEIMHGFDDKGSRFDAQGNLRDWWTAEDRRRYEQRTSKLVEQYGRYVAIDDLRVNGRLTLGENIADLAGLTMAYQALQTVLGETPRRRIDGFTPEQRFFLSWAQSNRRNYRPEALRLQVNTNPHSPPRFRVIGPLVNMPEFAAAFGCKAGDPMVLPAAERVVIF